MNIEEMAKARKLLDDNHMPTKGRKIMSEPTTIQDAIARMREGVEFLGSTIGPDDPAQASAEMALQFASAAMDILAGIAAELVEINQRLDKISASTSDLTNRRFSR